MPTLFIFYEEYLFIEKGKNSKTRPKTQGTNTSACLSIRGPLPKDV